MTALSAVRRRHRKIANRSIRPALTPKAGESQLEFFERAMKVLRLSIASVNRRTIEVLRLWKRSANDSGLRQMARRQFPRDSFIECGPRCVFIEHTVPADKDLDRNEICYDKAALALMVRWANYRIQNSGNFAAISDGHTPSGDERSSGAQMPEVLGYSGPFYMGLFGDVDPKWAIYADEWIHRSDVARFEKLQRRSPEVWINEPMERRTMDPIAALGAETPRLDSGMNPYSRVSDGQTVMRYSAMAFPGPANTFVPAAVRRTQHYSGDSSMVDANPATANVPAADLGQAVQEAVEALMPTIVQAVQEYVLGEPGSAEVDESTDDTTEAVDAPQAPDGMDDDERTHYAALSDECRAAYLSGRRKGASLQRYSRGLANADGVDLHRVVARQQAQLNELRGEMQRERRDVARYSRLNELARDYVFDVNEEAENCQDMNDSQFERHCLRTIVKYSRRDDATGLEFFNDPMLPADRTGSTTGNRGSVEQIERYSREAAAIAARKNATKRGSTTFEAEFEAICRQHGLSV